MSELSDLVQDSLLATTFPGEGTNETIHVYHERSLQNRRQGARTERWVRRGRIGGGGFGIVWREERADDCDEVKDKSAIRAVKEIDLRGCTKRLFFNRELETIAKFSQRKYDLLGCFVKSYGWYQTAESLFIAMEYLELGDLQTYLSRDEQPPLAEYEAQDIAYQVLYGLREMHDNDFVHRDLKPGNILIASCPPNNWWVKLADFGISKRVGDGKDMPTTTKGTPGYMAPELQELTERGEPYTIDIWAAGEITFQLLTKTKTFPHAGALVRYIADIISFPFGSLQDAGVSDSCVEFILALMSPQPRDRPSAKEALETTWLKEALPIPDQLTGRTYCSPYVDNAVDSMTEEFASWNTVTAAQTETTIVLSKLESSAEPLDSMPVEAHFEHTRELMQPAPSMVSIKPPPGIPQLPPPPQSLPVKRFTESSKYNQAANAATLSQSRRKVRQTGLQCSTRAHVRTSARSNTKYQRKARLYEDYAED
ncbi:kinase-like domain-containing protein [Aspergillus heterothallicus]